jgi:hypothetical protein
MIFEPLLCLAQVTKAKELPQWQERAQGAWSCRLESYDVDGVNPPMWGADWNWLVWYMGPYFFPGHH